MMNMNKVIVANDVNWSWTTGIADKLIFPIAVSLTFFLEIQILLTFPNTNPQKWFSALQPEE